MLKKGDDVPVDKKEAIRLYKISVDKGNHFAMYNYANILSRGQGETIDFTESFKYFKKAADLGDDKAIVKCGEMLQEGNWCERNREE